ncbi:MAG TPA: YitT family protein [Chitinophagaceae bacterium]|nr:YitT family protein [Chitinophagaceae bacterium]
MQFDSVYGFLMSKLEQELPRHLTYHNAAHTKEVVDVVQQLAASEGVSAHDAELVRTAALFHDSGFLEGYDNHEERSCKLAKTYLPQYGYTDEQIHAICTLIRATRWPQHPKNKLENVLCDADLAYLGSDKYKERAETLFAELKSAGQISKYKEWQQVQLHFLKTHRYFTPTAIKLWSPKKLQNLTDFHNPNLVAKQYKKVKSSVPDIEDFFLIIVGVITAGFALKGFLVPNHFFDGGVTGISLLIHSLYGFDLSLTTIIINLPFIAAGLFVVNKRFATKTLISVLLLAACLLYIPYPTITSDKLLISIFGGIFLGVGSGMAMRAGCALDGIEVLALYTWKRTSFTIYEIIFAINILIFGIAALRFGVETALYSILTYLAATKTIDFVVEGIEAYTGVTIISGQSEIIKSKLVNELGRSITIYKGERGFLPGKYEVSESCDIIFTVITRLELRKLKNLVYESDANAFVFANTIKDAAGGIINRRHAHH